ncbi:MULTISPECIES: serine O-acetyltransferase EpsC [unclassified Ruminococcus]|uniref:serine O-acetyltransferase EpsC n=1 Tax=unclassified Ruminococcus TaxID=2608920 RepID=UPI00210B3766|nr:MULTISPECIES: serine O-acetyltransferase EpsC [unclassified Ruminococcus]MCQ4022025.1 serine acetyltransferase [Ruminococcus sp. zg-924]MCQ4114561.1 serine acetyltransferase [Ruminococcus sp. zg-921]
MNSKENKMDKLVGVMLESYDKYEITSRIDADNIINKEIVMKVLEEIRKLLFPGYFDTDKVSSEYIKFLVGQRLEFVQSHLKKQIAKALGNREVCEDCGRSLVMKEAQEIVDKFLLRLPVLRDYLSTDIQAAFDGDPAAYSTDEVIFSYPGVFAVTVYRIAHELLLLGVPMIPRMMTEYAHSITGIDIHPGATIGKYFFIDHGTGIVIGETTIIGDNVKIYQGVTLGALSTRKGQQLKGVKRHPTIGDNVTIYSGTTILGGETVIGNGATIGGNAFIVNSVSEGMKVSVKNPELQFSFSRPKDAENGEFWDWVI